MINLIKKILNKKLMDNQEICIIFQNNEKQIKLQFSKNTIVKDALIEYLKKIN